MEKASIPKFGNAGKTGCYLTTTTSIVGQNVGSVKPKEKWRGYEYYDKGISMHRILFASSKNGRKHYSETFRALPHPAMNISGVALGATYDPDIELLYDVADLPTVELAAINATIKVPVVVCEVAE